MEKKKTLRETLDLMNVGPGDSRGFMVQEGLFSRTVMNVSRRYLESAAWKHLLDRKVLGCLYDVSPLGEESVKFILESE
jgi:hypothetical protein